MRRISIIGLLVSGTICLILFRVGVLQKARGDADLVISVGPEPQTLDPGAMSGVNEARYAYALYEGLVTYAEDGVTIIPGIAESWTVSDDKKVYTFKLRKTKWSNGEPLTADDFVYSWLRADDPVTGSDYAQILWYVKNAQPIFLWKGAVGGIKRLKTENKLDPKAVSEAVGALVDGARRDQIPQLESLRSLLRESKDRKALEEAIKAARDRAPMTDADVGVRAFDDTTLEVTLESPAPFMLDLFGFHTYMPVNPACVKAHGDAWVKPQTFVGNGPFVLEEWWPQYRVVLKKNPHYWDAEHVKSNRIVLMIMDSSTTSMSFYDTGYIDFLDRIQIPSDFLDLLSKRDDYHRYPAFGDYFLRYNVTQPPFNDVRVRRAFTHAIDRVPITDKILKGGEFPYDLLTPPFPGYDPGTKGCPHDEALAKKYMDEAFPDRSKFPKVEFLTRNSKKGLDLYAYLREQWKRVLGVEVGLKSQEWSVYLTSMSKLDYEVSYGGWQGDYSDPHTFIDIWITGGGNNRTGWGNKDYDKWVEEALNEIDQAKRFRIYQKCEKMIVEDECIIAPMYVTAERIMYKPYVKGVQTNPMDRFLFKYFYRDGR